MGKGCPCSTGCVIVATTLVFLYAFDLLQLDSRDLHREPIEDRKAELAKLLRRAKPGLQFERAYQRAWRHRVRGRL
jgi:ATP-dependent DNA ligase